MAKKNKRDRFLSFWVIPSVVIRIILPPLIFKAPLLVSALVFIVDWVDSGFYYGARISKQTYQLIDKLLDLYWYIFSFIFLFSTPEFPFKDFLFYLFSFRLIGQLLFFKTKNEKYFLIFPNFYENIFLLGLALHLYPNLYNIFSGDFLNKTIVFLFAVKIIQEIIAHTGRDYYSFLPRYMRGPK